MPAISLRERIAMAFRSFTRRERFIFFMALWVFVVSTVYLALEVNARFLEEVPHRGGALVEGVVGAPSFINPLLVTNSDTDRDLTMLVYSGLMRAAPDGSLFPDLAETYDISEDGRAYTFILREDAVFHDGEPVTADDVAFTVTKAQDNTLKSPKRASWEGVLVEALDERTIRFILEEPYSPFLENTTLGILPHHIWQHASSEEFRFSQFNIEPIGSGPYKVSAIKRNDSGVPIYYDLEPFDRFVLGSPYVEEIRMRFYANEADMVRAFRSGEIESMSAIAPAIADQLATEGYPIRRAPLPRVFGVFFNQNEATLFTEHAVREALDHALDKERIISEVLHGYGTVAEGPIPRGSVGFFEEEELLEDSGEEANPENESSEATTTPDRIAEAAAILEDAGWEKNDTGIYGKDGRPLAFSVATSDVPELRAAAAIIEEEWRALGADATIQTFSLGDLTQNIIRPRRYDALLFGEITGRDADPFAFWHSSQRNDPGLNIALYANITADKLLEDIRATSDPATKREQYRAFQAEVAEDIPAVFIYNPEFIYILPETVRGVSLGVVTTGSERFLNIHEWFMETNRVWNPSR